MTNLDTEREAFLKVIDPRNYVGEFDDITQRFVSPTTQDRWEIWLARAEADGAKYSALKCEAELLCDAIRSYNFAGVCPTEDPYVESCVLSVESCLPAPPKEDGE